jgi:hypothetical protein
MSALKQYWEQEDLGGSKKQITSGYGEGYD